MNVMDASLVAFSQSLTHFEATIPDLVREKQEAITAEMLERLIDRTPKKSGRAKGHWKVFIDTPQFTYNLKSWSHTPLADGLIVIASRNKPYSALQIVNALPYIIDLEYGSSKQAPSGFARLTYVEILSEYGGLI